MNKTGLSEFNMRMTLDIIWTVAVARFKTLARYKGWLVMDISIPIVFAAMPVLLGIAFAGSSSMAQVNFDANLNDLTGSGTMQFEIYMLVGANVFMIVANSLWQVGFWIRRERMTGTLESIYLTPTSKLIVLAGISLYANLRSILTFFLSFTIGCLIFGANPFQGQFLIAILFILVGLIPLWGVSFFFGTIVMKIKEANALINIFQLGVTFIMGVYFPIQIFPKAMQALALSFPPTWMTNGVRSAILDLTYFLDHWYMDLAFLLVLGIIFPIIGVWVFKKVEDNIKRNEGVGHF